MTVCLEFLPGLVRSPDCGGALHHRLDVDLQPNETIPSLLKRLAGSQRVPVDAVFDIEVGALHAHLQVVHNDRLVSPPDIDRIALSDGDTVSFVPLYAGG